MTGLKLSEYQLSKMMRNISDESVNLPEAFSLAVWSLITEPGDTLAAAFISTLGARVALESELAEISAKQYSKLLIDAGFDDSTGDRFKNLDTLLRDARERWKPRLKINSVEAMLNVARASGAQLISRTSEHWPKQLDDLTLGAPHCLWVRGTAAHMQSTSLAVVGARQATSYGEWCASEIVTSASREGISIVSGGAYGVDAIAHRASLALKNPTVAIMAGGVDRLYPSGNTELLGQIIKYGAVISEQAPGSNPTKWRFLQRNRLIAALSKATVVVEAGKRSGAINTAHHAVELGRPLGVVPGPISSPTSMGCHNLIRENPESLLTSAQDAINLVTGGWQPELFDDLPIGPLETRALDAMGRNHIDAPEIASRAGLTARELLTALGRLQLLGLVAQGDRGWRKLT